MVVIGCKNPHGVMTEIPYSTYDELRLFAVCLSKRHTHDCILTLMELTLHKRNGCLETRDCVCFDGRIGNGMQLHTCAKEVAKAFHKNMSIFESSEEKIANLKNKKALPPPSPIEREHIWTCAVDMVKATEIDVCIILLQTPIQTKESRHISALHHPKDILRTGNKVLLLGNHKGVNFFLVPSQEVQPFSLQLALLSNSLQSIQDPALLYQAHPSVCIQGVRVL